MLMNELDALLDPSFPVRSLPVRIALKGTPAAAAVGKLAQEYHRREAVVAYKQMADDEELSVRARAVAASFAEFFDNVGEALTDVEQAQFDVLFRSAGEALNVVSKPADVVGDGHEDVPSVGARVL